MFSMVAVGKGFPTGFPLGWESILTKGIPHVGILWEIVIPICGNSMGIPTEILWEWDGNGYENSLPTVTLSKI